MEDNDELKSGHALNMNTRIAEVSSSILSIPKMYDVIVTGAGPAGAFLAGQLARAGLLVLLVEKCKFPRHKICGCCLGAGALFMLATAGADKFLAEFKRRSLDFLVCHVGQKQLTVPIPSARSLSRENFDSSLVLWGCESGVIFLPETNARVASIETNRVVVELIHNGSTPLVVSAKVFVAADGIGGTSLSGLSRFNFETAVHSRIGMGCIINAPNSKHKANSIQMYYHPYGYLGSVLLEDDRLNLAASVDVQFIRRQGTAAAMQEIADYCSADLPDLASAHWRGTAALTRRRKVVWGDRIFVTGDSAGYVEPFTGEGMTSALASAQLVAPLVIQAAVHDWQPALGKEWQRIYNRFVRNNQMTCRVTTAILHRPALTLAAANVLSLCPDLGRTVAGFINRSYCARSR